MDPASKLRYDDGSHGMALKKLSFRFFLLEDSETGEISVCPDRKRPPGQQTCFHMSDLDDHLCRLKGKLRFGLTICVSPAVPPGTNRPRRRQTGSLEHFKRQ